jgi:hypothetical protein
MRTSTTHLILAAVVVVITLTMAPGGAARTSAEADKREDPGAQRPFQKELCLENGIAGCGNLDDEFNAPVTTTDGEPVLRLVIEYVSGECTVGSGGINFEMSLHTVANGTTVRHAFAPIMTAASDSVVAQATRLYADPGSQLLFSAPVYNAHSNCRMKLSGHLAVE